MIALQLALTNMFLILQPAYASPHVLPPISSFCIFMMWTLHVFQPALNIHMQTIRL